MGASLLYTLNWLVFCQNYGIFHLNESHPWVEIRDIRNNKRWQRRLTAKIRKFHFVACTKYLQNTTRVRTAFVRSWEYSECITWICHNGMNKALECTTASHAHAHTKKQKTFDIKCGQQWTTWCYTINNIVHFKRTCANR